MDEEYNIFLAKETKEKKSNHRKYEWISLYLKYNVYFNPRSSQEKRHYIKLWHKKRQIAIQL